MKELLLALILLSASQVANAQSSYVLDGIPDDSVVFGFTPGDSLHRYFAHGDTAVIDTTGCTLWQIGATNKPGFVSGGVAVRGIITDTLQPYPANQDDYFILKGFSNSHAWNQILTFEHRYETTPGHAGGCVELSNDSGATWKSIFQLCNDSNTNNNQNFYESIVTDSFYTRHDTLQNGTPAFSGSSNGYIRSRLQLFEAFPMKALQAPCYFRNMNVWVRFRFLSDSTAGTLAGWSIRRIVLENDIYQSVRETAYSNARLSFSPNPSATGVFHLDDAFELTPGQRYEVRNSLGTVVLSGKPAQIFDLSRLPKGLYWIRLWGKEGSAVGKVLWE